MKQMSLFDDRPVVEKEPPVDEWSDDGLPENQQKAPAEWWNCPASDYNTDNPANCCSEVLCGKPGCAYKETGKPPSTLPNSNDPAKFVAFDLEIAAAVRGTDWKGQRPLGISCAATLTSDGDSVLWYARSDTDDDTAPYPNRMNPQEVQELAGYLLEMQAQGYMVVTWNGASFDFDVLAEECRNDRWKQSIIELTQEHIDPGFQMVCEKGYMIGLETAGVGLNVGAKTEGMHGDLAPVLWCGWPDWTDDDLRARISALGVEPGTRAAQALCLEYVAQDAKLTADVYSAILETRRVSWISRSGRYNSWYPTIENRRMLSVQESLVLPEVDTSWMTNPKTRDDYLDWMKEDTK